MNDYLFHRRQRGFGLRCQFSHFHYFDSHTYCHFIIQVSHYQSYFAISAFFTMSLLLRRLPLSHFIATYFFTFRRRPIASYLAACRLRRDFRRRRRPPKGCRAVCRCAFSRRRFRFHHHHTDSRIFCRPLRFEVLMPRLLQPRFCRFSPPSRRLRHCSAFQRRRAVIFRQKLSACPLCFVAFPDGIASPASSARLSQQLEYAALPPPLIRQDALPVSAAAWWFTASHLQYSVFCDFIAASPFSCRSQFDVFRCLPL